MENYLWVRTIIRDDTIRKVISVNPPPHLFPFVLFICRVWEDHQSRWLCLQNVPLLIFTPQKEPSPFNRTHCYLMIGNRDKRKEEHTLAQCRHVNIHQLPAKYVLISAHCSERKWMQGAHSPPTISKQHLQQSFYSNRPGAIPQSNQWHLSALWKKLIMGWGSAESEGRWGRC